MATISPIYARIVTRRLPDYGVDAAALFQGTGTNEDALWQLPELELAAFSQLLLNADQLYDETPIGFLIGEHHSTHALGPIGIAMASAPNLREGFQALATFSALHTNYIRVRIDSSIAGLRVQLSFKGVSKEVIVGNGQDPTSGCTLVSCHPISEVLGVVRLIGGKRQHLLRKNAAVTTDDVTMQVATDGSARPFASYQRREYARHVV